MTFPYPLRLRLARNPNLLSAVLSDLLRTVFTWQRLQARRAGITGPLVGAVTSVQLWGSLIQLTPHFHCLLPDGVFTAADDGAMQFHRLQAPEDADIELLLERVAQRVLARFDGDDEVEPDDDDLAVANAQAESLHIVGLTPLPAPEHDDRPLCAVRDGFTLHADRLIAPQDRADLRRAIRYGLRPPLSLKRLSLTPDGKVRLELRKPLANGRTDLLFEPLQLLRRLAASIPRPRKKYAEIPWALPLPSGSAVGAVPPLRERHAGSAPNARARPAVASMVDSQQRPSLQQQPQPGPVPLAPAGDAVQPDDPKPVPKPYRRPWAELLAHVLDHDVLRCPRCADRKVPVQIVKDPAVIWLRLCPGPQAATAGMGGTRGVLHRAAQELAADSAAERHPPGTRTAGARLDPLGVRGGHPRGGGPDQDRQAQQE